MRKLRICLLALLLGSMAAGPALADSHLQQPDAPDADETGRIVDFDFAPRTLTVDVGDTIAWTNDGARPHTVTDRGGTFDSGSIAPGASDEVTFSVPGTYFFFCRINPGSMNGVIEVRPGDEAPSAVRVQAIDDAREDESLRFDPDELEVEAGTPVILANVGGKPHTLTADDGSFDTGIVNPGASGGRFAGTNATVVPTQPGTFPFHCVVHPEAMTGTLVVTGEARDGPRAASAAPPRATIDMVDFDFDPAEASVAPGGTVRWTNSGNAPHTATFDDVELDTGNIDPGADGGLVAPAEPGSYSYRCAIHPAQMRGTLVVVGQGVDDPTRDEAADEAALVAGPGAVSWLAVVTGVAGAFVGGFGVAAFMSRRRS